jgi:hypothetical protein
MRSPDDLPAEPVSAQPQLEERRVLVMSLQALLDPAALAVVGALGAGERSVAELAAEHGVRPSLSGGPLGRLVFLQIVTVRRDGDRLLCRLSQERLRFLTGALGRLSKELFADPGRYAEVEAATTLDAVDRKILRGYLRGQRLLTIPDGPERLQPVLRWLVTKFEPGRRYPEREVNAIIAAHHEDFATLRRALVDFRFMERADGVYWRLEELPTEW